LEQSLESRVPGIGRFELGGIEMREFETERLERGTIGSQWKVVLRLAAVQQGGRAIVR
jgi:hypothetical protein